MHNSVVRQNERFPPACHYLPPPLPITTLSILLVAFTKLGMVNISKYFYDYILPTCYMKNGLAKLL
jgi:hypothetical protein